MDKRVLSIVLVVLVGLGIIGAVWLLRGVSPDEKEKVTATEKEETTLKELALEERPYVSLTPRVDGRELHLIVAKLPKDAVSMEYELVYQIASGITQGVPGNVKNITGKSSIERDLLLGTCSSGKCRYDEGVEEGTFTLRFRDNKGKMVYRFETGFHLQENPKEIISTDDKFKLSGSLPKGFYLTMKTFGLPGKLESKVVDEPYGVFTRVAGKVSAAVILGVKTQVYTSRWIPLADNKTSALGTFVAVE